MARKKKQPEPVKVNFTGSTISPEAMDLHDRVLFIVEGTVKKVGSAGSESSGDQEFRTVKMESAIMAPEDIREQLAILVQKAKDDAAGVQSIDFPDEDEGMAGEPE